MGHLDEAGVLSKDPETLRAVRIWFEHRLGEPVTREWLRRCKKAYRPPKFGIGPRTNSRMSSEAPATRRVWIVGFEYYDSFPTAEETAREAGKVQARGALIRPSFYEVDEIRCPGRDRLNELARPGDILVQVSDANPGAGRVFPHGRILHRKSTTSKAGNPVVYFYVEMPRDYRTISWKVFKSSCRGLGLKLGSDIVLKAIRDKVLAGSILQLVSPEKLGRRV